MGANGTKIKMAIWLHYMHAALERTDNNSRTPGLDEILFASRRPAVGDGPTLSSPRVRDRRLNTLYRSYINTPPPLHVDLDFTPRTLVSRVHPVGEKRGTRPNTNMATMDNAPTLPAVLPPEKACEKHDGHR